MTRPYRIAMPMTTEEKLIDRCEVQADGCWLWTGSRSLDGYGRMSYGSPSKSGWVHRVAYETWVGPIPEGLTIDHLCNARPCVNPTHMEPVTQAENNRRSFERNPASQRRKPTPTGGLPTCRNCREEYERPQCKPCHARREKARYWRLREGSRS